jgi:hypothetical protein
MSVLKEYGRNDDTMFWLFEGFDSAYYGPRIWQRLSDWPCRPALSFKNCGGKENILRIIKLTRQNVILENASIAYFVDRDFNWKIENLPKRSVFVTEGYSIENYYSICSTRLED